MIAILITRPEGPADALVQALRQRHYRVHAVATMQTEPVDFDPQLLAECDWIVLTSVRGVQALDQLPAGPRFAAVGPETARALRARGVEPEHIPDRADGSDSGRRCPTSRASVSFWSGRRLRQPTYPIACVSEARSSLRSLLIAPWKRLPLPLSRCGLR